MAHEVNLAWVLPVYPDRVGRSPRRPLGGLSPINVEPIPRPTPPTDLTWRPCYPDRPRRQVLPLACLTGAVLPLAGLTLYAPLVWLPIYPSRITHKVLPTALQTATAPFQISAILQIAKTIPWRPQFPDRLPRRFPNRTIASAVELIDPYVIGKLPIICIELHDETLILSGLDTEVLLDAALAEETCVSPILAEETLC